MRKYPLPAECRNHKKCGFKECRCFFMIKPEVKKKITEKKIGVHCCTPVGATIDYIGVGTCEVCGMRDTQLNLFKQEEML